MNLSRLDVAYDDFDGLLNITTILNETLCNGYDASTGRLNQGNFVSRFSDFDVNLGSKGVSCYYGSKSSDVRIRIYDKKAERKRDDIDHWVRCELQLRGANAIGFAKLGGDICKNYFDVLNNYVRFVTPSTTDSNKRRWQTADWWDKFLQSYDSVSIFSRPGVDYNIMSLNNYVFGQCVGAVKTMIDIIGVGNFFKQLRSSSVGKQLNPKYKDLKNQYGTSSDSILDFLRERGAGVMASQKQRELWMCYVVNQREHLENDVKRLQTNLRYRRVDAVDCMELALAVERLNCFNEFASHATEIFKIMSGNDVLQK
ncbi:MAG: replication initiation factor domain-containing protein [Oscillospiraceae bacterium]|nr:replication initiation factor domain-containing protein [Oscillospiraceae bacterium]